MPWYREGKVTVTNGSTSVTGVGTDFASNSRVGDAFIGPNGALHEVTNVASATVLAIFPPYAGPTAAGASYTVAPIQGYVKQLADQAQSIIQQWGSTLAGLGSVSTENVVPVAKGGTGGTTQAAARSGLGLGSAATLNAGRTIGGLAKAEDLGWVQASDSSKSWMADASPGFDSNLFGPGSPGAPTGGTGYYYKQTIRFGAGFNRLVLAWPYGIGGNSGTIKFQSIYGDNTTPLQEIYHTGNTTRATDGTLKAI